MKLTIFAAAFILRGSLGFAHAQDVTVTAKDTRPDDSVTQQFMALDQECRNYVSKHDAANAVIACKKVSDEADKYDSKTHPITRRGAYVFYATALIQSQKYQDAVKAGDKAVAVVLMGFDDGSGSNAAYFVRGQARADAGDLNGADQDLEKAEKFEHDALNGPAGQDLHGPYSKTLKWELMFHAQVLAAMGNKDAASKKSDEASKL
jgi:tetratricopeptide (TPR) repeat protein